jgi:hypothetical protein
MCVYILFWLTKLIRRILLFPLFLFILSGCYNNSHIRTSKILEEGEKVTSFNGSLNIAPEESIGYLSTYDNFLNVYTGIAGLRGELSILRGYKHSEAGLSGGVGVGGGSPFAWHVGLEYKKYINSKNRRPFKAGINIELNKNVEIGTAIHSIQSIKTTTSKKNPFYGGLHSIFTYGSQEPERYQGASYNFLMKGVGITLGIENFSSIFSLFGMNTSTTLQIDASLLSSKFLNLKGVYDVSVPKKYPTISASLGFNFFNTSLKKGNQLTPLPRPKINPVLEFDPESGDPIKKPPSGLEFNPETGIPIKKKSSGVEFDPETGEPVFDKNQNKNRRY